MIKQDRIIKSRNNKLAHIKNTEIPVNTIVAMMSQGKRIDEIIHQYPQLEKEDIYQSLGFISKQAETC